MDRVVFRFQLQGKEAFVSTAKDVISSCQRVTQFIGFVTEHCLDQQCTDELLRITECIYTTTKQLTIISSVNAVTPGCRSSDEILVKNAQNLLHIILQGIRAAEAACIKGLKQPEPNSEGTEAVALCFQWRQNLMIHRAQQNSSLETDDLGLRKICPHEAAPSLAPVIPMQEFYRQKHSSLHFQSLCFLFMTAIKKPTLHDCVVFMFFLVRYT
ncbi:uncharacterized protein LOC108925844 isoform X4 [Scleropages formosus]|uniref:uncharacterized protein LOC108925844 isoform X4 n=1 Tax=Scleropages formosus TaxID=113540 RepID=UPI0010FA76E0|nr:uncharacterized protein LOC108925844 isoform X4 [Scleropages formosus]